jgi:hypothetical protein
MLVLDENLPASQRALLRKWRIHFRAIGVDLAARGTQDANLIPLLHKLPKPTLFTLDQHFFQEDWAHPSYGLVWLDVRDNEAAKFIRRFLKHPAFDTRDKRLGLIARVHNREVVFWRRGCMRLQRVDWP